MEHCRKDSGNLAASNKAIPEDSSYHFLRNPMGIRLRIHQQMPLQLKWDALGKDTGGSQEITEKTLADPRIPLEGTWIAKRMVLLNPSQTSWKNLSWKRPPKIIPLLPALVPIILERSASRCITHSLVVEQP